MGLPVMLTAPTGEAGGAMSDPVPRPGRTPDPSGRELARWAQWSSGLHESLASHEASAEELRQELDELRRTLDAAPAGAPVARRRSGRRVVGVVVVLALVLAGGLVALKGSFWSHDAAPVGVPVTPT